MTPDELARICRNNRRARKALSKGKTLQALWYACGSEQRFEIGRKAAAARIPSHF